MNLVEPKDASQVRIGLILPVQPDPDHKPEKIILGGCRLGKSIPSDYDANGINECGIDPHDFDVTEIGIDPEATEPAVDVNDGISPLILPTDPEDKRIANDLGEETSSMSFPKYIALRPKTCKPRLTNHTAVFDASRMFSGDMRLSEEDIAEKVYIAQIEELTQATLEFIGEVGELGGLFFEAGPGVLWGEARKKLIDEAGDILFTGMWAIDSWCLNPHAVAENTTLEDIWGMSGLYHNPFLDVEGDTEIIRVTEDDILAQIANHVIHRGGMRLREDKQFMQIAGSTLAHSITVMTTCAALTANAAKKLIFQRRHQDITEQIKRITTCLYQVNAILVMANSSIEEAMLVNRAKIDKRFPGGYRAGQGGGIWTEG